MPVGEGDTFCGSCGASIAAESVSVTQEEGTAPDVQAGICPSCEGALTPGDKTCLWCGEKVAGAVPPPQADQVQPKASASPVGQEPPGASPAAAAGAAGVFGEGANDVSERVEATWENPVFRLPLVFLASMILGFVLFADVTRVGIAYPLILGGIIFALLVIHATSPTIGDGPILVAAGIALVFSALASLFGSVILVVAIASDGPSFGSLVTQEPSGAVTLGAALALIGSVGLFLTTLRAYILELIRR